MSCANVTARPSAELVYDQRVPTRPPKLNLITSPELTHGQKVLSRVKRRPRPQGMLACPRCGSRDVITIRNGVVVKGGKQVSRGTVIVEKDCGPCWKQGITTKMVPGGQGPKLVR